MAQALSSPASFAIIGFGEVGPILAKGLLAQSCEVSVFDIKATQPPHRAAMLERAANAGVTMAASLEEAVNGHRYIVSAVTASQAHAVAKQVAANITAGQIFIDLNSVSPNVKQRNSALIEAAGGDYVESAVMAPVPPQGLRVPMLLGGKLATSVSSMLNELGMNTKQVSDEIGLASAIKLCRSIMIKGMEALCVQSMQAANHFGVDQRVLTSLAATFPGVGWDTGYEAYLIGRVVEHGQRRSEEMREAALMLEDLGMDSALASAVADVQQTTAKEGQTLLTQLDKSGALPTWRTALAGVQEVP